jgi:putative phosphoribosyl transferase
MTFADRVDAGRQLSRLVEHLRGPGLVVLGLPRGGVPVAFEVAQALQAPLDVIVVRKLGVPDQPELGLGAIGESGVRVINPGVVRAARVSDEELAVVEAQETSLLIRRARLLRGDAPVSSLSGRTALIIDDGIATGSTARAACQVARARGATRVVLAVPVAAADVITALRADADEVICALMPSPLMSIGQWYDDFSPTSDEEVRALLARAETLHVRRESPARTSREEEVTLSTGPVQLRGHLTVPEDAPGVVVFVHGSGSSRHSPRNRFVATVLNQAGLATLLFDLLSADEEADRANVFDIELLADRLARVTAWVRHQPWFQDMSIGWFGASTGAGAALWAAADPSSDVAAIVSRGGRPDLAGARLASVRAPTLLIVGGVDTVVLELNRAAQARLRCTNELVVVPGATHLFEEPGTLAVAAGAARDWFTRHLRPLTDAHPGSSRRLSTV